MQLHTLSNGLQVLLDENHNAPVLSYYFLVKVGSADETNKEAGISHLIEHMLFKGTPTRPVGSIAREVEACGGYINAYTSFDQTAYYINMASRYRDKGLAILADAIQNPLFDAEELEREKEVVLEEVSRGKDNPSHLLSENLFDLTFQKHNYGRPIIGFEKTVRAFTRKDVFNYFKKWYTPSNVVVIVVGDFNSNEMLRKIEKSFPVKTAKTPPTRKRVHEPLQKTIRTKIIRDNIQTPYFGWGYHIPEITHVDIPALDILSHVLGGAESSRLEQVLKEEKQLVQNIYAYAYTPKDPGIFMIGGQATEQKYKLAFQTILKEIEKIKQSPISNEELKNAKLNIFSSQIYEKETVSGIAGKYTYSMASTDDPNFEKDYYHRLNNITAEDVRDIAEKYLSAKNKTAILLLPNNSKKKYTNSDFKRDLLGKKPSIKKTPRKKGKQIYQWTLGNGIRLIVKPNNRLPLVSLHLAGLGGSYFEKKELGGLSLIMSQTLTKGTSKRSSLQITQDIEGMAGYLEGYFGKQTFGLKCGFLSEHLDKGLDLFTEVLLETKFDSKEVAKEKKLALEAIRNQEDSLTSLAFLHFQKKLFPGHPYGRRSIGEPETIARITPQAIRTYFESLLTGPNLVLSVVGDVNPEEIRKKLSAHLKQIPKKSFPFKLLELKATSDRIEKIEIKKEKMQAHIVLGFRTISFKHRDHYPLILLSNILSGQGGRLFTELRDKMSLAYSVTSILQNGLDTGFFATYIGTDPSKVETAITGMKQELSKITKKPISVEELKRTQQHLVGTYELDLQKNSSLASSFTTNVLYGLGIKEIELYPRKVLAVTKKDIQRVAKKYINLNSCVLSIVRP